MRNIRQLTLGGGFCLLLFAGSLHAGTIGPSCGSCFGGVYSLDGVLQIPSDGTEETWRFTYSLDLNGYTGTATYVGKLAAKVVEKENYISDALVLAPTGGAWNQVSGKNINQCDGSGFGWVCLEWDNGYQLLTGTPTPVYSWMFDITVKPGSLLSAYSIQADFDPPTGQLLSETISVPEATPAELPLLLSGLGALALWRRRAARSAGT